MQMVLESFAQLQAEYDVVIIEGAGSPAEPNLREGDIANMGFAEAADVPVWLVGDIDCGGVFAALIGSLDILSASENARVKALLINRFRGNLSLLDDALVWLEQKTGRPVAGVIPYLPLELPEEDAPYRHSTFIHPNYAYGKSHCKIIPPRYLIPNLLIQPTQGSALRMLFDRKMPAFMMGAE